MTPAEAARVALSTLSPVEREAAVVYVDEAEIEAGGVVDAGGAEIRAPWRAVLAFVDLAPTENWGHPCRYVLIEATGSGDLVAVEAQFPPFLRGVSDTWRVTWKAQGVPDWALATVKGSEEDQEGI